MRTGNPNRPSKLAFLLATAVFAAGEMPAAAAPLFMGLGDLTDGIFSSVAFGVSDDGSVVVGGGSSASGGEAFRWTQAGGMQGLGDLPGGNFGSTAFGVSADGSVVVGRGAVAPFGNEAFRLDYSNHTTLVASDGLGDLPGGFLISNALGVSGDG